MLVDAFNPSYLFGVETKQNKIFKLGFREKAHGLLLFYSMNAFLSNFSHYVRIICSFFFFLFFNRICLSIWIELILFFLVNVNPKCAC